MAKRSNTQSTTTQDSSYFTRLGMEVEVQRLEEKAAQIRAWLGRLPARGPVRPATFVDGGVSPFRPSRRRRKGTMSAEARKRISEAQKARWAKQRGEQTTSAEAQAAPAAVAVKGKRRGRGVRKAAAKRGRRKMSAAGRRRISDPQKKRWAAKRKAA